jgi:hypothetical protein
MIFAALATVTNLVLTSFLVSLISKLLVS